MSAKISLLVIAAAVAAGIGVALVDYNRAAHEMRQAAEDKLLAVVQARAAAILDYVGGVQRDLRLQATSPFVIAALEQFIDGRDELAGGNADLVLRAMYGANGEPAGAKTPTIASGYATAHDAAHPTLRSFIDRAGFDDLLLLDGAGKVVYSVRKRGDFASDVANASSGLGSAFRAARAASATSRQVFIDFRPYPDNGNAPTAFASVAIRDGDLQPIGFIGLAISPARINQIMGAAGGLRQTGETLLLGADMMIRGSSRLDYPVDEPISIPMLDVALESETGGAGIASGGQQHADGTATDVLVAHQVLDVLGTRWIVLAKADLDEVYAPIAAMRNRALASSVGIALLVALGALILAHVIVVRPMNEVVRGLRTLAEGDRRAPLDLRPRKDEIGDIGRALTLYRNSLAERDRLDAEAQREATLIEIARRFRVIAEAQPHPVLVIDRTQHTVRYANPAAAALLLLEDEGTGPAPKLDDFLEPSDSVALGRIEGSDSHQAIRMRRADGSSVAVSLSARHLEYDGVASLIIGLVDLTERDAARMEIERQQERIHQGEKLGALGSLLAGVAHELNNPLSIVVGQSTMFEDLVTDPELAARAAKIRLAAERCAGIVRTFLSMARQRPLVRAPVDLNDAAIDAVDLLGYSLRTSAITLDFDLADPLPPIHADADQIRQVIANLVANAQQAMADWPGARHLRISTAHDQRDRTVRLSVADSGPGVPTGIRSRVLEPFFTTKPVGEGTGIGLAVSHGMVVAHGGTLDIEETPGGGATFVVRLPIGESALETPQPNPPRRTDAGGRALVVDDELGVAETLAAMLARAGLQVTIVGSGQDGIRRLQTEAYDIVFSDLRMPGMDGITFYHATIGTWPELAGHFVVVTGDMMSTNTRNFIENNSVACLEKPFVLADVLRIIAVVLPERVANPRGIVLDRFL